MHLLFRLSIQFKHSVLYFSYSMSTTHTHASFWYLLEFIFSSLSLCLCASLPRALHLGGTIYVPHRPTNLKLSLIYINGQLIKFPARHICHCMYLFPMDVIIVSFFFFAVLCHISDVGRTLGTTKPI